MPSKWRITVTLPERFKEFLEQWAEDEHRSVSNLAASILINAAEEKISESQQDNQKSQTSKKPKARPKSNSHKTT
ncbi:MAG: hypothetical protein RM338_03845 [Nostoc sp. DedQUE12a]|nr:hypothetical protein [Nostoc sp. DedQUE12a]